MKHVKEQEVGKGRHKTDPLISSSRTTSRPVSTSETSTFLRQALLPFREGWVYWWGAALRFVEAIFE